MNFSVVVRFFRDAVGMFCRVSVPDKRDGAVLANLRDLLWRGCSLVSGLSDLRFGDPQMLAVVV